MRRRIVSSVIRSLCGLPYSANFTNLVYLICRPLIAITEASVSLADFVGLGEIDGFFGIAGGPVT